MLRTTTSTAMSCSTQTATRSSTATGCRRRWVTHRASPKTTACGARTSTTARWSVTRIRRTRTAVTSPPTPPPGRTSRAQTAIFSAMPAIRTATTTAVPMLKNRRGATDRARRIRCRQIPTATTISMATNASRARIPTMPRARRQCRRLLRMQMVTASPTLSRSY